MSLPEIRNIAVVGASQNPTKLGTVILNNILNNGFTGNVYPVNPNYPTVLGEVCYPRVSEIKGDVDTVVVVVPAAQVVEVVQDSAKKEVKTVIIISAGFRETGPAGLALENQIAQIASKYDMRIVGPNCLGIMNTVSKLNATFANNLPKPGNIAFLSQSGAFTTAMLDMASEQNVGFYEFISLGNKLDVSELDYLKKWVDDPNVGVIGMYLEEFADGNNLVDLAVSTNKPIVVLKPGSSSAAQKAIGAHTGSLAGDSVIAKTAMDKANIVTTESIVELFDTLRVLSTGRLPQDRGVTIVTNAGGPGIMLADLLSDKNLELVKPTKETQQQLRIDLPPTAAVGNPIDLVGDAQADRYQAALDTLLKSEITTNVLVMLTPQYVTQVEETAKKIIAAWQGSNKLIIPIFSGGTHIQPGMQLLWEAGIPAFIDPADAVNALANTVNYASTEKYVEPAPEIEVSPAPIYRPQVQELVAQNTEVVPTDLAQKMVRSVGITLPQEQLVTTFEQAAKFADTVGFPLVLKATASQMLHKTETGGVITNISDYDKLEKSLFELKQILKNNDAEVLVQQQIAGGSELFVGVQRDGASNVYADDGKGFGHMIIFGTGGIHVELYKDLVHGLLPMDRISMQKLVEKAKVGKIIDGWRGKKALNKTALLDMLMSIQNLIFQYPEIASLDINPVILTPDICVAVDVKIFIKA